MTKIPKLFFVAVTVAVLASGLSKAQSPDLISRTIWQGYPAYTLVDYEQQFDSLTATLTEYKVYADNVPDESGERLRVVSVSTIDAATQTRTLVSEDDASADNFEIHLKSGVDEATMRADLQALGFTIPPNLFPPEESGYWYVAFFTDLSRAGYQRAYNQLLASPDLDQVNENHIFFADGPLSPIGLGDWIYVPWMGTGPSSYEWTLEYPFVYHYTLGYLCAAFTNTATSEWLYSYTQRAWLYTDQTDFPYFYRASDGAWLWYDESTTTPNARFYNLKTSSWETY